MGIPPRAGVAEAFAPPLYYQVAARYGRLMGLGPNTDLSLDTWFKLRSVGVIFGVLAVAGVFCLSLAFEDAKPLAVLAAAVAGLTPMFCFAAGTLGEGSMAACLCAWSAVLLVRGKSVRQLIIAGILAGLAYETSVAAVGLIVLWLCLIAFRPKNRKIRLLGFAISLAIGAPFWIHSTQLYHNPLGLGAPAVEMPVSLRDGIVFFFKSAVGVFGDRLIFLPNVVYVLVWLFFFVAITVGIVAHVKLKNPRWAEGRYVILFGAAVLVIFIALRMPEARGLCPAICALGLISSRGLRRSCRGRPIDKLVYGTILGFILLNAYATHIIPGRFQESEDQYSREHPAMAIAPSAQPKK
jgi:hypothetical protein